MTTSGPLLCQAIITPISDVRAIVTLKITNDTALKFPQLSRIYLLCEHFWPLLHQTITTTTSDVRAIATLKVTKETALKIPQMFVFRYYCG